MATPNPRTKILVARGTFANLEAAGTDLSDGELCFATDTQVFYVKYGGQLINIVGAAAGVNSVNGQSGDVTLSYSDVGAASAAQGDTADSALQPGEVNPVYFSDQAAFPDAGTSHGAIAHSHADGAMYFAHSGAWNKLANQSEVVPSSGGTFSGNVSVTGTLTATVFNLSTLPNLPAS